MAKKYCVSITINCYASLIKNSRGKEYMSYSCARKIFNANKHCTKEIEILRLDQ
jgi:hypothetical protein